MDNRRYSLYSNEEIPAKYGADAGGASSYRCGGMSRRIEHAEFPDIVLNVLLY